VHRRISVLLWPMGILRGEFSRARNRVPDVLMAQIVLDRARIVPITGELVAGAVPQHVGMNLEGQPGLLTSPLDHPVERGPA
jgi:hypothetical protein